MLLISLSAFPQEQSSQIVPSGFLFLSSWVVSEITPLVPISSSIFPMSPTGLLYLPPPGCACKLNSSCSSTSSSAPPRPELLTSPSATPVAMKSRRLTSGAVEPAWVVEAIGATVAIGAALAMGAAVASGVGVSALELVAFFLPSTWPRSRFGSMISRTRRLISLVSRYGLALCQVQSSFIPLPLYFSRVVPLFLNVE